MLISRQRKTNVEARRNSDRPHHADKQRVEISALATLGGAGPDRIAVATTGAGLVVAHRGDDVVVDCSGFLQRGLNPTRLLRSEFRDDSLERGTRRSGCRKRWRPDESTPADGALTGWASSSTRCSRRVT